MENGTLVTAVSDPTSLPLRLKTSEVCALGRFSKRTFERLRQPGGKYEDLQSCGRGTELLWKRDDVLRALDMVEPAADVPQARPAFCPERFKAARAAMMKRGRSR